MVVCLGFGVWFGVWFGSGFGVSCCLLFCFCLVVGILRLDNAGWLVTGFGCLLLLRFGGRSVCYVG